MKRLFDNERLVLRVCNMYYMLNMSGVEICRTLNISRPTFSKLIQYAKDTGMVTITLCAERQRPYYELELGVEEKFGLKECIVTDTADSRDEQLRLCGAATAKYLGQILRPNDTVGIGMGVSITACTKALDPETKPHGLMFVPLVGGLNTTAPEIHSNYLARCMAERFGGSYLSLYAPARVERIQTKQELMMDQSVRSVLDMVGRMNVAVLSIGATNESSTTLVKSMYFTDSPEFYSERGIVGDVCLIAYNKSGQTDIYDFNNNVICADIHQFYKIPYCIGIAGGVQKKDAIAGAIAGKYINVLITDSACAHALMDMQL